MATSPNLSELGQLGASDLANTEATLITYNNQPVVGIQSFTLINEDGDSTVKRQWYSRKRYEHKFNRRYSGTFTISGGRLSDYMTFRNFLSGFGSSHYGYRLRSNQSEVGWLVITQKTIGLTTTLWRVCVPSIVIGDLPGIPATGAPGTDNDFEIPWFSTSEAAGLDPLVYPVLETFTMTTGIWQPNTGTATTIITSEIAKKLEGGGGTGWVQDEGTWVGSGYIIEMYERTPGTVARPYGGTPITDVVTVVPNTPSGKTTITVPGAARAETTEIDVLYTPLFSDLS